MAPGATKRCLAGLPSASRGPKPTWAKTYVGPTYVGEVGRDGASCGELWRGGERWGKMGRDSVVCRRMFVDVGVCRQMSVSGGGGQEAVVEEVARLWQWRTVVVARSSENTRVGI